jgi:pimeloyl-ACP methyl ester carboxylesterase
VGGGVDAMLDTLAPLVRELPDTPRRDALLAALNGVLGDHLAATGNPLAIPMRLRRSRRGARPSPRALAARVPRASATVVVAVHGLCMSDRHWARDGHDHRAVLARALAADVLSLSYNTGLHVSTNGRELAALLETLVDAWPVEVKRLVVVGHSMGGLVARSAAEYGARSQHRWRDRLDSLVFLGTPHHGSPLERAGHGVDVLLESVPYAAPFARLGRVRSAGITDMRYGSVADEDWQGRDRFARGRVKRMRCRCLPASPATRSPAASTRRWWTAVECAATGS